MVAASTSTSASTTGGTSTMLMRLQMKTRLRLRMRMLLILLIVTVPATVESFRPSRPLRRPLRAVGRLDQPLHRYPDTTTRTVTTTTSTTTTTTTTTLEANKRDQPPKKDETEPFAWPSWRSSNKEKVKEKKDDTALPQSSRGWWPRRKPSQESEPRAESSVRSTGSKNNNSSKSSNNKSYPRIQTLPPTKTTATALAKARRDKIAAAQTETKKESKQFPRFFSSPRSEDGQQRAEPMGKVEDKDKGPSLAARFQSLWNTTQDSKDQTKNEQQADGDTNPLFVVQNMIVSAATSSMQRISKQLSTGIGGIGSTIGSTIGIGGQQQEQGPTEKWIPVFPKTRISPGEIVPVTIQGIDLLVVASKDGTKLYCMLNSCPHLGTPLALETGLMERRPIETTAGTPSPTNPNNNMELPFTETDVMNMLQQDGCEDCIVCPLHRTAFALESGQVRGEWCPYPPVIGPIMGSIKPRTAATVYDIRTRGKYVQVRILESNSSKDTGSGGSGSDGGGGASS